jgi:hypothetical protein
LPDETDLTELMLVIEYDLHELAGGYLRRMGGPTGLAGFEAATARLKADGGFAVAIPDFLADPSIAALAHSQGLLYFSVRTRRFLNGVVESYNLRVVGGARAWAGAWRIGLPPAPSYGNSVTLERDAKASGARHNRLIDFRVTTGAN